MLILVNYVLLVPIVKKEKEFLLIMQEFLLNKINNVIYSLY